MKKISPFRKIAGIVLLFMCFTLGYSPNALAGRQSGNLSLTKSENGVRSEYDKKPKQKKTKKQKVEKPIHRNPENAKLESCLI